MGYGDKKKAFRWHYSIDTYDYLLIRLLFTVSLNKYQRDESSRALCMNMNTICLNTGTECR